MKRILISLTSAIAILCSCEKPVDTSMIIGSWTEYYDDPLFIIDGSIDYTFNEDGTAMNPELANDNPGVHPNAAGYAIMESLLLPVIKKLR